MIKYIFFCLFFIATASSAHHLVPRLEGGYPAPPDEFQYIAFVENYNTTANKGRQCTGSFIAPNAVITSAWCTIEYTLPKDFKNYHVAVSHKFPAQINPLYGLNVNQVIPHPDYNTSSGANDIALLILEKNADIVPTKIYTGNYSTESAIRFAGFGDTDRFRPSLPNVLMAVDLKLETEEFCQTQFTRDTRGKVCTEGSNMKGPCGLDDIGGPLAIDMQADEWALFGIYAYEQYTKESPHRKCAEKGSIAYYTYIAPYVDWISKTINRDVGEFTVSKATVQESSSEESTSSSSAHTGLSQKSTTIIAAVCGSVGGAILAVVVFLVYRWWKRNRQQRDDPFEGMTVRDMLAEDLGVMEDRHKYETPLPPTYEETQSNHMVEENKKL